MITSVFVRKDLYPQFLSNYPTCSLAISVIFRYTQCILRDLPCLKVTSLHIKLKKESWPQSFVCHAKTPNAFPTEYSWKFLFCPHSP